MANLPEGRRRHAQVCSSPIATGGAGTFFEQHIGAYWLALLLVEACPPILLETTVRKVSFQTEHVGWHTDDALVVGETSTCIRRRIACQAKKEFSVGSERSRVNPGSRLRFAFDGRRNVKARHHIIRCLRTLSDARSRRRKT